MSPIIQVHSLGKQYRIRHNRGKYVALRDVLTDVIKRPFRFAKAKAKQVLGIQTKEDFWALRDISFEVETGEVVGVIGKNGAGKSTLLKILTGITPPTEGEAILRGKVASLLEVGTGFHPELSGRENIFLNGAILGMTKKDISRNFDAIVDFSGVEKFIDTPVKYYSSGMYVRLAFSVAAHMEPDILLVDEVLAVGDVEFQKRCLGKMEEVTTKAGRTILFVSHNMSAVQTLCKKTLLLDGGNVGAYGKTEDVIHHYLNNSQKTHAISDFRINHDAKAQVSRVSVLGNSGKPQAQIPSSENFSICIEFEVFETLKKATVSVLFYSQGEKLLLTSEFDTTYELRRFEPGKYTVTIQVPAFTFNAGSFFFDILIHHPLVEGYDNRENIPLEITNVDNPRAPLLSGVTIGKMAVILKHTINKIN